MRVTTESIRELVGRAKGGHRGALGRLTTHVARGRPEAAEIAGLTGPPDSDAHVVGITGAPGGGKSSLTGQLLAVLLAAGRSPPGRSPVSTGAWYPVKAALPAEWSLVCAITTAYFAPRPLSGIVVVALP